MTAHRVVEVQGYRAFDDEGRQGIDHFASFVVEATVLPLQTREDAFRSGLADEVGAASMVLLAGAHPEYPAAVFASRPVWEAVEGSWRRGMVVAGCRQARGS